MLVQYTNDVHRAINVYRKSKTQAQQKEMLSFIKTKTEDLTKILEDDKYPQQVRNEITRFQNMVDSSLRKLEKGYKPTPAEKLHEEVITLLNDVPYAPKVSKSMEDKIAEIIEKEDDAEVIQQHIGNFLVALKKQMKIQRLSRLRMIKLWMHIRKNMMLKNKVYPT